MGRMLQHIARSKGSLVLMALLLCASCLPVFCGQAYAENRTYADGRVEADTECFLRMLSNSLASNIADEEESTESLETVEVRVPVGSTGSATLKGDLTGGWGKVTLAWYHATSGADALARDGISADLSATWELLSSQTVGSTLVVAGDPQPNAEIAGNAAQQLALSGLAPGTYAYKLVATDELGYTRTIWWIVQVDEEVAPTPDPEPEPDPEPQPTPDPEPTPAPAPAPVKPVPPRPAFMPKLGDMAMLVLLVAVLSMLILFVAGKRRKDDEDDEEARAA